MREMYVQQLEALCARQAQSRTRTAADFPRHRAVRRAAWAAPVAATCASRYHGLVVLTQTHPIYVVFAVPSSISRRSIRTGAAVMRCRSRR